MAAMKGPKESFTDVINRLAGKKSVLDLVGLLTPKEGAELRSNIQGIRARSRKRAAETGRRIRGS